MNNEDKDKNIYCHIAYLLNNLNSYFNLINIHGYLKSGTQIRKGSYLGGHKFVSPVVKLTICKSLFNALKNVRNIRKLYC